jgi:hypothetical protein
MADFAGFNIETPQEVLARLRAQRTSALQSGDFNAATQARTLNLLDAIFGNPEAQRAKEKTDAAKKAFTELDQVEGEDDIDFRRRQTEAFFAAIKDVDPALAAQASERLTQLQNERLERDRLASAERRRESNEKRLSDQEEDRQTRLRRANLFDNLGYAINRKTEEREVFDLGTEEGQARFRLAAQNPDMEILTRAELEARGADELSDKESALFNRSTLSKKLDTYEAMTDSIRRQNRIVQVLTSDPDTLTVATKLEKGINNLVQELGAVQRATAIDLGGFNKDLQKVRNRIAPEARARGVTDAMVLNLAYSLARAMDPGGRLSDKDLELALDMIGGRNADPSQFARIALESTELNTQKLTGTFEDIREALSENELNVLGRSNTRLVDERDKLREAVKRFVPENEFESIINGIPVIPQSVIPSTPVQSATPEQPGQPTTTVTVRLPGLD